MKQSSFEERHRSEWNAFAKQLERLEQRKRAKRDPSVSTDFPAAYRQICLHLALARERQYGSHLIDRLNQLALRGYQQIYKAPSAWLTAALAFLASDFPRLVRREARLFWLCAALFCLPLLIMGAAVFNSPELIYSLLDPDAVTKFESTYRPDGSGGADRSSDSDLLMFGFYIYNNIGIGFRTFASGLFFGLGASLMLIFNGVYIGAVAGYLSQEGYTENFYSFVIAHGAFELTGIVLAGVAGMKLGLALLAPERRTRRQALRLAAAEAVRIVYGVIALLLLAAFVEAFWSSNTAVPSALKYAVGAACWGLVIAYLLAGGRRAA